MQKIFEKSTEIEQEESLFNFTLRCSNPYFCYTDYIHPYFFHLQTNKFLKNDAKKACVYKIGLYYIVYIICNFVKTSPISGSEISGSFSGEKSHI